MNKEKELIKLIEMLAMNAWPASIQETFDDWKLRANFGVTKRANSVYTIGNLPKEPAWLQKIEQFYVSKSIPPCFYISKLSPSELDHFLELKGYCKVGALYFMAAQCEKVLNKMSKENSFTVQLTSEASRQWIDDFICLEQFSEDSFEAYAKIFSSIKPKKKFLSMYLRGKLVGLGTVVVEKDWGCISNVVVEKSFRRQGIATQLIGHLTEWAFDNGAQHMYLQVIKENIAALKLYEKIGFTPISSSHYRMLEN